MNLPEINGVKSIDELLTIRATLPKVEAGHPLQTYKWKLATKLRRLRVREAGVMFKEDRDELFFNAGPTCPDCCKPYDLSIRDRRMSLDHIVAIAQGGPHTKENVRVICMGCNSRKGIKTV